MTTTGQGTRKYMYVYDLPKNGVTSVKLAELFKQQGITVSTQKPQIHRDLFKPFYTAIIPLEESYEAAKEKMRYFEVDGKPVRALPFDPSLRGDNKAKIMDQNVFYKFPKDVDINTFDYEALEKKFKEFGQIKSIKIAFDENHNRKGYAFVCFETKEDSKKCIDTLGKNEMVVGFS